MIWPVGDPEDSMAVRDYTVLHSEAEGREVRANNPFSVALHLVPEGKAVIKGRPVQLLQDFFPAAAFRK